jgi:PKD repeat protein
MSRDVQFTDASSGNPTGFSWDFGDESALSTEKNPLHTYEEEDTYNVAETISKVGYSPDTAIKQVSTETLPKEWNILATYPGGETIIRGMVFYKIGDLGPYAMGIMPIVEGGHSKLLRWNGTDAWTVVVDGPNDENVFGLWCHNDRLYTVGPDGQLYSWGTGELMWTSSEFIFDPIPASVRMVDFEGVLYVVANYDDDSWQVFYYDDETDLLEVLTEIQEGDTAVSISPHVPGSDVFVLTNDGRFCSVDIGSGDITDIIPTPSTPGFSKLSEPNESRYYTVCSSTGKLLSWGIGETAWTVECDSTATSLEVHSGRIYLVGTQAVETYRYKIASGVLVLYADHIPYSAYLDQTYFINGILWATSGPRLVSLNIDV